MKELLQSCGLFCVRQNRLYVTWFRMPLYISHEPQLTKAFAARLLSFSVA